MNIYDIEQEYLDIERELEENEGEITPELEERININQENLTKKVKAYTEVIKSLESNIEQIKKEKDRLTNLQKSKEKTIDSLNKILIEAVNKFGDCNKSGNKFIDFGLGKVIIRNTTVVELNNSLVERTGNAIGRFFTWCIINNVQVQNITRKDLIEFINQTTPAEEMDGIDIPMLTEKDLDNIKFKFTLNTTVDEILCTNEGRKLYNILSNSNLKIDTSADKTAIKKTAEAKEHFVPAYAEIKPNQSLNIK